jgi:hypothetical protein
MKVMDQEYAAIVVGTIVEARLTKRLLKLAY